jgi:type II secretory pathway pseudopilin PulG
MVTGGFTLVEVIVTILATAILGAIFINYMGTAMSKSVLAVDYVDSEARAEAKLEEIITDYLYEINKDPSNALTTIKAKNYGSLVIMQYIQFNIISNASPPPNNIGTEEILTTGTSNTLKVTVKWDPSLKAEGRNISTLLTTQRVTGSPAVSF